MAREHGTKQGRSRAPRANDEKWRWMPRFSSSQRGPSKPTEEDANARQKRDRAAFTEEPGEAVFEPGSKTA
jgi:hypothetical protein